MYLINRNKTEIGKDFIISLDKFNNKSKLIGAESIIIKPNFAAAEKFNPGSHAITDIGLLRDVVRIILDLNSKATVYIAESDSAGHGLAYMKFKHLNIPGCLELSAKNLKRVQVLDLSRDKLKKVTDGNFKYFTTGRRQLNFSETLLDADFVISLSNIKTHALTKYSGACKNLFGCLPDFKKSHYHRYIHKVIHDVNLVIKPQINIVDGFYAMDGNGPLHGRDINLGFRIITNNAAEADMHVVNAVGMKSKSVKYLKYLGKEKCEIIPDLPQLQDAFNFKKSSKLYEIKIIVSESIQKAALKFNRLGDGNIIQRITKKVLIAIFKPVLRLINKLLQKIK